MLDFQTEVIARSQEKPVVVDFWAAWCGPCRVLGPVIERLEEEAQGKWELVKVDTEANQEVSRQYQIMSIPAVKMFYRGEVVGEFVGALSRGQILKWLEEHLPDKRKDQLADIKNQLETGNHAEAINKLESFVMLNPDIEEANLWLGIYTASQDPERAISLVDRINADHPLFDQAEDVRVLAEFYLHRVSGESPVEIRIAAAQEAALNNDMETLLQKLVEAIMVNKSYQNELARRVTIAFFHLLGNDHPLTKKFRPRFSMALY